MSAGAGMLFSTFMGFATNMMAREAESKIEMKNAEQARQFAEESAAAKLEDVDSLYSEQVARYAKAGVYAFSGSPMMILSETLEKGIADARKIKERGYQEAKIMDETRRARSQSNLINAFAGGIEGGAKAYAMSESSRMERTGVGNVE